MAASLGGAHRGSRSQPSRSALKKRHSFLNSDVQATHERLRAILLGKESSSAGGRRSQSQTGDGPLAPVGEDMASDVSPTATTHHALLTPAAAAPNVDGVPASFGASAPLVPQESPKAKLAVSHPVADEGPAFLKEDREKEAFVAKVCSDSTRLDVRDWVGRIHDILKKAKPPTEEEMQAKSSRRHRKAWSASGASDTTTLTGTTTLLNAGGSIAAKSTAAASRKAPSLISAESMIVHPGRKIELLATEERLRAFLRHEIPELTNHVNAHVAKRAELVRREFDEELVESHLLQMRRQQVFDGKANQLRWQNLRRICLQKRLDAETPVWILEAVQSWDQRGAMKAREDEINEADLIFDYVTKRAAHINTSKLATEIPAFKALHASYSLPRMWRDKYLEMH